MKKRTSSFDMEMGSNIDLSLLRRPLTPFTGFQEAKSAFEKGTAEVRHLLLHECSLIYECNVCRNMFRSLANFISHKRVFCCKSALEKNDSHDSTNCTETRKSSAARDHLTTPKNFTELHQKHKQQVQNNEADDAAAAAIVKKTRCLNIESSQEENRAAHEDNLLASPKNKHSIDAFPMHNDAGNQQNVAPLADQSSTSYVFQCPLCSLTFLKSSSVIRHLALAHNIPMRRIRMMRDTITKRPVESISVNGETTLSRTKPNRELNSLLRTTEATSVNTTVSADEIGENSSIKTIDEDLTNCIFCQKSFDRRATLLTHLQTCHIKLEMLEETAATTATPTASNKRMRLQSNASSTPKNQTVAAIAADVEYELHEEDDVKRTFAHLEQQDFGAGLQTVSLDKLDISAGESTNASIVIEKESDELHSTSPKVYKNEKDFNIKIATDLTASDGNTDLAATSSSFSPNTKKRKIRTNCILKQSCRCKICGKQFNALSNLRRHISMFHYRSRKFGCALCDYCAFRRYDIVNHLGFVHKMGGEDDAETAKLVRVNDVPYTKDDMDEDIVLLSTTEKNNDGDENHSSSNCELTTNEQVIQPEKRRRRRTKNLVSQLDKQLKPKSTDTAAESSVEVKLTRLTLKRSLSQNSAEIVHSTTKANQKRPTRNRVKPVNKDFVYDLNHVVKKEQDQSAAPAGAETEAYHLRGSKRRNTLNAVQLQTKQPSVPAFEFIKPKMYAAIKGAARRSCLLLVSLGLAASSTLPEIPSERPQMRSRLVSMQRSDSQAGPIIDSTEIDAARLKSLPLCDDSYLEKIAKESVGSFQMRPCLAQQHSALDELLQKVDSSKNFLNGSNARLTATNQVRNEVNEVVAQTNYLVEASAYDHATADKPTSPCYISPEQSIPKVFVTPSKPQKRLPSLDRLTETINASVDSYFNAPPFEQ